MAQRGAMLFFLLMSLSKIHAFYQYNHNSFVTVFGRGLDNAPGGHHKPAAKVRRVRVKISRTCTQMCGPAACELESC